MSAEEEKKETEEKKEEEGGEDGKEKTEESDKKDEEKKENEEDELTIEQLQKQIEVFNCNKIMTPWPVNTLCTNFPILFFLSI